MEFKEPSLISFAKLLQSEIEDFGNIDSLPADAKLFLTKAKKWIEESSEIEVLPPPVSGYAILFRRTKHLFISQMKFCRFMPSPSAFSQFVLSVLEFLGTLKFSKYTQNVLGILK